MEREKVGRSLRIGLTVFNIFVFVILLALVRRGVPQMTGLKITARSEHATATCCSVAISEQILRLNNLNVLLPRKFFQISPLVSLNLNREELEKESRKVSERKYKPVLYDLDSIMYNRFMLKDRSYAVLLKSSSRGIVRLL